jgi:hypothetical protein
MSIEKELNLGVAYATHKMRTAEHVKAYSSSRIAWILAVWPWKYALERRVDSEVLPTLSLLAADRTRLNDAPWSQAKSEANCEASSWRYCSSTNPV